MSRPDTLVVGPELTIYQVASLRTPWLDAYAAGARDVDLSGVTEIDGAGAQLLLSLWQLGRREGDPVRLSAPSAVVREALALLGAHAALDDDPDPAPRPAGADPETSHA